MLSWGEIRAWRKAERELLIARRLLVPREERESRDDIISDRLLGLLTEATGGTPPVLGFYWPFKGEYDPRPLVRALHRRGTRLALPVVIERRRPLIFREWWPGASMSPGVWNIPVPSEGEALIPDILLVPLVGFDCCSYRLGYGGGYYDRTLAAMTPKPLAVGIGFEISRLETIYPQLHDVPMDLIITENRVQTAESVENQGRKETAA
ncbi:5-formyltetrahydrofolate cyclo-ligase [Sabulicella rubraurantiaca]|uniref:5-formyltetrahydrofolate cyclo-ligase n=1 Tax=Sabulicella rubraurantiaca TaxID=2811429 RepID=UPI001A96A035|nr:5-formyltetrahydrofolate cyclo-ligase [Sabulicella rubraurantiaca]